MLTSVTVVSTSGQVQGSVAMAAGIRCGSLADVLTVCPHCGRKVLPVGDGRCPSCSGNTRESSQSAFQFVVLHRGMSLPSVCVQCGAPAEDWVRVNGRRRTDGEGWFISALVVLLAPLWLLSILQRDLQGTRREVSLSLPHCRRCKHRQPRIAPDRVNFEHDTMTFRVHHRFAAALHSAEPASKAAGAASRREQGMRRPE